MKAANKKQIIMNRNEKQPTHSGSLNYYSATQYLNGGLWGKMDTEIRKKIERERKNIYIETCGRMLKQSY